MSNNSRLPQPPPIPPAPRGSAANKLQRPKTQKSGPPPLPPPMTTSSSNVNSTIPSSYANRAPPPPPPPQFYQPPQSNSAYNQSSTGSSGYTPSGISTGNPGYPPSGNSANRFHPAHQSPLNPNHHTAPAAIAPLVHYPTASASNSQQNLTAVSRSGSGGSTGSSGSSSAGPANVKDRTTAAGVAAGAIGGGYGPYSYQQVGHGSQKDLPNVYASSRLSTASDTSPSNYSTEKYNSSSSATQHLMYDSKDVDPDDYLHNPDPVRDAKEDRKCAVFSSRGILNVGALIILAGGLVALFAGYPVYTYFAKYGINGLKNLGGAFNLGGTNSTGQVPSIAGLPGLIDLDTPDSAKTKVATNGKNFQLVFSDEFNKDGRQFYPGDDPYWEAVNLHYWQTVDLEWYDPDAITTKDGSLQITITAEDIHDLKYRSGMLQSWNKFCFTGGIIEVNVSLPGVNNVPGFWPGAWTMGNLARAGYGATTDGVWPYSYETCDLGIAPNQSVNGNPADAAGISFQPGQRLPSCTCPGSDHPNQGTPRGGPEIDILEAQVSAGAGQVSQSAQFAPYNIGYKPLGQYQIFDQNTQTNSYQGGPYQQAMSAVTNLDGAEYGGQGWQTFSYEYYPGENGYITWQVGDQKTWTLGPDMLAADSDAQISARTISKEPMYMIFNLGMSHGFSEIDFANLPIPATFNIDYVRIYQDPQYSGPEYVSCSPPNYPTSDYIENHINAYTNPNLTTWAQAGYEFPKNTFVNPGC